MWVWGSETWTYSMNLPEPPGTNSPLIKLPVLNSVLPFHCGPVNSYEKVLTDILQIHNDDEGESKRVGWGGDGNGVGKGLYGEDHMGMDNWRRWNGNGKGMEIRTRTQASGAGAFSRFLTIY